MKFVFHKLLKWQLQLVVFRICWKCSAKEENFDWFIEQNRKLASEDVKWRCIKNSCKAHVNTLSESIRRVITSLNDTHSHDAESQNFLQVLYSDKKKRRKWQRKNLLKLWGRDCLMSASLQPVWVWMNMYYARRKLLPALPKSASEVYYYLKKLKRKTNRSEDFL